MASRIESRSRVFPLRISLLEENLLRQKAQETGKSIATLIREGLIHK